MNIVVDLNLVFFTIVLMISGVITLATAHGLAAEMPITCQNINSAKLMFELPLEIERLTL